MELPPGFFLIVGADTGLSADEHVAAVRWLSDWYATQADQGSIISNAAARDTAKELAAYARTLEEQMAASPAAKREH